MDENQKQTKIEVYFTEESGLHDLRLDPKKIKSAIISDNFLKIHDKESNGWHCYNLNIVSHIHYPENTIQAIFL